jgi:aerobic-type carbon monoxide dehydrogenase small subunit (CoxS/CutS family)
MTITVNGRTYAINPEQEGKRLVMFLREDLDLTGTKNACDIGACGACTVLLDDVPMKICTKTVRETAGRNVLTIEGMAAPDGTLHPLQQAFVDQGAIQCGFCTPGMVLTAHALLLKNPNATRAEITRAIYGNLCRCTGYQQIVDAIVAAVPYYQRTAQTS